MRKNDASNMTEHVHAILNDTWSFSESLKVAIYGVKHHFYGFDEIKIHNAAKPVAYLIAFVLLLGLSSTSFGVIGLLLSKHAFGLMHLCFILGAIIFAMLSGIVGVIGGAQGKFQLEQRILGDHRYKNACNFAAELMKDRRITAKILESSTKDLDDCLAWSERVANHKVDHIEPIEHLKHVYLINTFYDQLEQEERINSEFSASLKHFEASE